MIQTNCPDCRNRQVIVWSKPDSNFETCKQCGAPWMVHRNLFGPGFYWRPDTIEMTIAKMDESTLARAKNIYAGIEATAVIRGKMIMLILLPIARIGSKTRLEGKLYTKEEFFQEGWILTGQTTTNH